MTEIFFCEQWCVLTPDLLICKEQKQRQHQVQPSWLQLCHPPPTPTDSWLLLDHPTQSCAKLQATQDCTWPLSLSTVQGVSAKHCFGRTSSELRAYCIMMYIFWQILRITNIRTKRSKQMLLIDRAIIIDSPSMTHLDCWHQSKSGTKIWHVYRHANHQPSSASYSPQPTNSSSGLHRWLILRANKNTQTHFHSHKARKKAKS